MESNVKRPLAIALVGAMALLSACDDGGSKNGDVSVAPGEVSIRWTEHGIPHVRAATWEDAAFGAAYAYAEHHACTLADQVVKVTSQRSRYFGPGEDGEHLNTDFAYLHLGMVAQAEQVFDTLEPELQAILRGYADGFARYLEDVGPSGLPSPCRDAEWVQPFTAQELLAYYLNLGGRSSAVAVIDFVATAQPPNAKSREPGAHDAFDAEAVDAFVAEFPNLRDGGIGSNGWGLGSERSAGGRGMLLSNTHFPTQGDLQWHEMHVTVEGENGADVYGVSLMGVFPLNMGFNEHVAWTHTVSPGPRLIGYRLTLEPGNPTRYLYDGEYRDMTSSTYSVEVRQADGSIATEERTLWRSHYGPILNVPPVGWAPGVTIAFRDANAGNDRMLPQWLAINRAQSLDEFAASFADVGGIPWVHTMAASADGEVYYTDASSLPYLSDEASALHAAALETDVFTQAAIGLGFYLVDGANPVNEWLEGDSHRPGLVPFDEAPTLRRRDYVSNSNDNHWLTNASAPLEGYHYLYGGERVPFQFPRTRIGLTMLTETGENAQAGADGVWTLDELLGAFTSGRAALAEVLLEQVRQRCSDGPATMEVVVDGQPVAVAMHQDVCAVLDAWDGRLRVDSRGAALWRQAFAGSGVDGTDTGDAGLLFEDAFDPTAPVATPAMLASAPDDGEDPILVLLAEAWATLDTLGIAADAALGDVQFLRRGDTDYPRHGGLDAEGAFSIADYRGKDSRRDSTLGPGVPRAPVVDSRSQLSEEGWVVNAGNSWVMAMEFTDDGPNCRALMTYGQSEDPESPHFDDQAAAYTAGEWRRCAFAEEDVAEGTVRSLTLER